ncbi:CinA family nicotinamide mononucleotide deamidase-related protein [uncultured Rikenella sp.]|uniref:CinA family nicotinamide mononucleotide deamidase-related protein n=1 Tax=uncultured Rikenella sp. TaxID=368003 RepID=UPI00262C56C3|nr:CinA family nicotinamide mononucleotide deamidase-related protein [uncultured Rikenella sp.]
MVSVELITVGDELLIGQVVDTNSAWLGRELGHVGAQVDRIVSVHDAASDIREAVETALSRADAVIMTGGLGPTQDDITKKTLADLFSGGVMRRDQSVFEHVRRMTAERGLAFNDLNQAQALVPDGATVLPNRVGTAPGMMFVRPGSAPGREKLLFSLPGVPFEMKQLVTEQVIPLVKSHFALRSVVHRTMITFGLAESALALAIAPWEEALPEWLHLAYLPNARGIRLRLSAYDVEADSAAKEIESRFAGLREYIAPYMLGFEPASVEAAVASILLERGQTLAVAESCTGGSISARITAMAGASQYYLGGVTSYSNEAKAQVLGVSMPDIEQFGAVSEPVARQMAAGALTRFGADYAVSTTGVAGPGGGTPEKPVGTVWMAIAWRTSDNGTETFARQMRFSELREQNIERAATHALNMLRLHLLGLSDAFQQTGML